MYVTTIEELIILYDMELILCWQVLMADSDEEEEEVGVSEYQTLEDLVREAKEAKEQEARDKVVI